MFRYGRPNRPQSVEEHLKTSDGVSSPAGSADLVVSSSRRNSSPSSCLCSQHLCSKQGVSCTRGILARDAGTSHMLGGADRIGLDAGDTSSKAPRILRCLKALLMAGRSVRALWLDLNYAQVNLNPHETHVTILPSWRLVDRRVDLADFLPHTRADMQ